MNSRTNYLAVSETWRCREEEKEEAADVDGDDGNDSDASAQAVRIEHSVMAHREEWTGTAQELANKIQELNKTEQLRKGQQGHTLRDSDGFEYGRVGAGRVAGGG